ncbi:hypothetical protein FQN60_012180, partial [Etheostoma spectabile]
MQLPLTTTLYSGCLWLP